MLKVSSQAEKDSEAQSLAFRSDASEVSGGALGPGMPAFVTGWSQRDWLQWNCGVGEGMYLVS